MREVVPVIRARGFAQNTRKGVRQQFDCPVTDGMETHLPAEFVSRFHDFVQLFLAVAKLAAIVTLVLVRSERVSRRACESSIDKQLDRSDSQAIIPIAGFLSERDH